MNDPVPIGSTVYCVTGHVHRYKERVNQAYAFDGGSDSIGARLEVLSIPTSDERYPVCRAVVRKLLTPTADGKKWPFVYGVRFCCGGTPRHKLGRMRAKFMFPTVDEAELFAEAMREQERRYERKAALSGRKSRRIDA